jgi:hypothetical protein
MAAIVTDQFRINNASNFLGDINDTSNSYYVFVGLSNPGISNAFGRASSDANWNADGTRPNPTDNINYLNHSKDTMIFGRKINIDNARRVIRKQTWAKGTQYEIYRHDYSVNNLSPKTKSSRLYDAKYYVINKDFNVYVCIDNASSGINTEGNLSQNEPLFTGVEPSAASGDTDDGYIWKYLFTVAPSDIIKFDATEYIPLPNNWSTSTEAQIESVRDSGNSDINNNQIKKVYIEDQGNGYGGSTGQEFPIVGDGSGGKVIVDVIGTKITNTQISVGGQGYTYGMVDLTNISTGVPAGTKAKLIPIIPPSKGHGYDLYKELGADRVLIYARFDDSTKDFPIDSKFAQIGIVKNPTSIGSTSIYTQNQFSSVSSLYLSAYTAVPTVGQIIEQDVKSGGVTIGKARAYVASFDVISDTDKIAVMKYYQDRSLYFNQTTGDQTDRGSISELGDTTGKIYNFQSTGIEGDVKVQGTTNTYTIDTSFSGITTNPTGNKVIELGVEFEKGISSSEINNQSGDIIYLDNRSLITRDKRQKEDIKVILEF